jgi:hypothetical protein
MLDYITFMTLLFKIKEKEIQQFNALGFKNIDKK